MMKAIRPDGSKYYEYIFIYTDDILILSITTQEVMTMINHHYLVKPLSIKPPDIY